MSAASRGACVLLLLAGLVPAPGAARADLYVWIDEKGRTHVTDDPAGVPEERRGSLVPEGAAEGLWSDGPTRSGDTGAADVGSGALPLRDDRIGRMLRGAVDDLARGNGARAAAALEGVLRLEPGNPEAHFYLALHDQRRGRFDSAQAHLEAFLAHAGDRLEPWRASARRRLQALEDERRMADPDRARPPLRLRDLKTEHFRIRYDEALEEVSPDYARTVARYLEEAHAALGEWLGVVPEEPTRVVLYGKAAYIHAHAHRFSFRTVGFFDGRIHVASAAHPAGELRALLFHEYAHALFREQTGGDRPYWLNEGLAELAESLSSRARPLSRSERVALRTRIETESWIPLRGLSAGFGGLDDGDARAAYLEATAAARWLERRTDREARRRLLRKLGAGASADEALRAAVGLDTGRVDAAVRLSILAGFPASAADPGDAEERAGDIAP